MNFKRFTVVISLFALTACNDHATIREDKLHVFEKTSQIVDLRSKESILADEAAQEEAQWKKEQAEQESQYQAAKAKADTEAAQAAAEEATNPHYNIVMQVMGLNDETIIYSHLTAAEASARWLTVAAEMESGHRFFTVSDPADLSVTFMVRLDQIQYVTINHYQY